MQPSAHEQKVKEAYPRFMGLELESDPVTALL